MQLNISPTASEMGRAAAASGGESIRQALSERGGANIILATGASQFEMLKELVQATDIDWSRVSCFHLDEYEGMPVTHPASFRGDLKQRFVDLLPTAPARFEFIDAESDCQAECDRLGSIIREHPIDVAFIGVGENGHLAFNDPPADFDTNDPYIVVELDEACRRQQLGEGWLKTFEDVPCRAISMAIRQILKSNLIVCTVPDERKSEAIARAVEGPVTPNCPASILQQHDNATLFLDAGAASRLAQS